MNSDLLSLFLFISLFSCGCIIALYLANEKSEIDDMRLTLFDKFNFADCDTKSHLLESYKNMTFKDINISTYIIEHIDLYLFNPSHIYDLESKYKTSCLENNIFKEEIIKLKNSITELENNITELENKINDNY